jgi:carbon-monoxide dehydrogenase small subunit
MSNAERLDYTLRVNGEDRQVEGAWYFESLLSVLRERLGLTGPKFACGHGRCGACTVHIDGRPSCSCLAAAATLQGREITTIEGVNRDDGELTELQRALVEEGAVQCGYCTPGFIMTATTFVAEHPNADADAIRAGIYGNVCRCTGYGRILAALERTTRSQDG